MESNLSEGIAFQIRATREAQGLTQAELAEAAGMTQNNLSRLESPEYGKQTISSLKRIAAKLDVAVIVRLVPFSQYITWLSGTPYLDPGISPTALAPPSFSKEEEYGAFDVSATYWEMIKKNRSFEPSENLLRALNPTRPSPPRGEQETRAEMNKDRKSDAINISTASQGLRLLATRRIDDGNGNISPQPNGLSGGEMSIPKEPKYAAGAQSS